MLFGGDFTISKEPLHDCLLNEESDINILRQCLLIIFAQQIFIHYLPHNPKKHLVLIFLK